MWSILFFSPLVCRFIVLNLVQYLSLADLTVARCRDIQSTQRTSLRATHAVLVVERVVIEYATIKLALVIERAAVIGIVARAVLA